MNNKIKVLIVDDAAFMRKTIRKILESEEQISVIGTAKNGQEAIKMNNELLPDVITLDIDMPVMDGITALKHMLVQRPVPVVVVSSLSYETNVTFEAFRLGVIDFIPKPTGAISKELEKQKTYLCDTVVKAAGVTAGKLHRVSIENKGKKPAKKAVPAGKAVIIGSSLGGHRAIIRMVSDLPAQSDFAVLVIMQMSSKVMDSFIQKLDKISQVKVGKVRSGKALNRGEVYFSSLEDPCPVITRGEGTFSLNYEKNACEFPIDHVMETSTQWKDLEVGGVLLAGIGQDGVAGLAKIYEKNRKTIVQNATNAVFSEKLRLAIQKIPCERILEEEELAQGVVNMMSSEGKK